MRIVFMGTPEFAVPSLRACFEVGEVVAVFTRPDRPKGRGQNLEAPPVKQVAEEAGVQVLQPERLKGQNVGETLRRLECDVCVVTAYGRILPQDVLDAPRHGCVNVHASLLPRWRGAAPIQWAIAAGDGETGVCLMQMDAGLDTGPVISCEKTPIGPEDTCQTLHQTLGKLGGDLLRRDLPRYVAGELTPRPQPEAGVTLAPMIRKEDGQLDFSKDAAELERRLRAFTPWPGAFTFVEQEGGGKALLKVHAAKAKPEVAHGQAPGTVLASGPEGMEVACGKGALVLVEVQPEGRRRMPVKDFLSGRRIEPGQAPFGARGDP